MTAGIGAGIVARWASPWIKIAVIGIGLLAAIVAFELWLGGQKKEATDAGRNQVITKTQEETILQGNKSRVETEKAHEEIKSTPWHDRVNQLP